MKKYLLKLSVVLLLVLAASSADAQTRTASATGNWNNIATWGGASVPTSANDVVINSGVTVTVNVAAAVCNSITFTAGASGAGITISGTNSLTVTGAVTMNGTTATTGTLPTLITVGTGSFSCASLALSPNAANLGSNNRRTQVTASGGTITVSGDITCSGDVVGAGGGTGISFSGAGTLNVSSNFYISPNIGNFTQGNSTVNYSGTTQTLLGTTYYNLTISGSGTKTPGGATTVSTNLALTAGTLDAGANLTMGSGGTPSITRSGGDMTGTIQTNNDYDVTYTGNTKTAGSELSGTGLRNVTVNLTAGQTLTLDQNRAPDGNLSVSAGTFDLSTFTTNRSGAGGTLTISDGATLKIGGTNTFPTNYNTHTIGNTSATVEYAGTAQNVAALAGAESYTNLTLSGSGVKTFAAETVNGVLSIQGAATTAGTTPTYGASAILEYKGSAAQIISNIEFAGTGANPANLRIDNTNGVTLNSGKSINGALTLVNGYLTTTGLLTINANGSASTTNGAFVNGPLAKAKNTTTLFTFPVGTLTGGLRTIGVTPTSTTATTYRATFISTDPRTITNGSNLGTVPMISSCEYWDLIRTSGATNARVTLSWPAAVNSCGAGSYVGNVATLTVANHNGTNWLDQGQFANTGDPSNGGTVTSNNFITTTPYSAFVLATTNPNQNPLPVMFSAVRAYQKNSGVQIEWSNLTERDLIGYTVERSANGQNFTAIGQQAPRSNTNDKESYTAFDAAPFSGTNFYRIRVLEISGKIILSKVLKVDIGGKQGFTLYPNPVSGGLVSVGINAKQGQYTVKVLSTSGQEVYSQRLIHQGGSFTQTVELPAAVKPGVYSMVISGNNYREAKMFVVQ